MAVMIPAHLGVQSGRQHKVGKPSGHKGLALHHGEMWWEGKVCVPESRVHEVIKEYHDFMGHVGIKKVVREVDRRFAFPPSVKIHDSVREVKRVCVICQACDHPN